MIPSGKAAQRPLGAAAATTPDIQRAVPLVNRTGSAKSPFVREKADDAVVWQVLDSTAVEAARRDNKLIFLHIGYKSCHPCHAMALESFSHPDCVAILNEYFVPIVVDREERPDIDRIYMNYVHAVSGLGGWPLNLFLTPTLEPIYGGTYWPGPGADSVAAVAAAAAAAAASISSGSDSGGGGGDDDEAGPVLDFLAILVKVAKVWSEQEHRCRLEATQVVAQLREFAAEGTLGTREIAHPAQGRGIGITAPSPAHGHFPPSTLRHPPLTELDLDQLEEAYTHMAGTYDPVHAGFGLAPKFPTPAKLWFLLTLGCHGPGEGKGQQQFPSPVQDIIGADECRNAADMALQTLRRIRDGGLRDHVGQTGVARCSVTSDWGMPNFERLVADNALLLPLYVEAWRQQRIRDGAAVGGGGGDGGGGDGGPDSEFFDMVIELVDYLTSAPIRRPDGGFASGESADARYRRDDPTSGEGAYHVWTRREFDGAVTAPSDAAAGIRVGPIAATYWDVRPGGNVSPGLDPTDEFANQNVLRVCMSVSDLAAGHGLTLGQAQLAIRLAKSRLRARRDRDRVRPETDAKAVAGTNGLVISALAKFAKSMAAVDKDRAAKCIEVATRAVATVRSVLWDEETETLYRLWSDDGRADTQAFADDYSYLIQGLLDLFDVTNDEALVEWAEHLQHVQLRIFYDHFSSRSSHGGGGDDGTGDGHLFAVPRHHASGGFYSTPADSADTILRLKDGIDTTLPSTNSVAAQNLFRLEALLEHEPFGRLARETVVAFETEMLQHPWLFPGLLEGVVCLRLGYKGPEVGKRVRYTDRKRVVESPQGTRSLATGRRNAG